MTDSIGLILLAAGGSARLGHPKQLLPYKGRTLLRHSAETALGSLCRPIIVVLGARADQLRPELADLEVLIAENRDWEQGMGSSISVGLAALETTAPNLTGVILMLCDQPLITGDNLNALAQTQQDTGSPFVASEYAETRGV
ncbi:MAG: nucleotidyltransferase family protein, partial [Armatimonadota bacterium]|nr:nucleotidyltransferase family protein [Armatimonadota bacterium]